MKKKIINKTLISVHKALCKSIEDSTVRKLVEDNTIITGGCIASMFLKEDVNDFDLYFRNKETVLAVARYYVDKFKVLRKQIKENTPIDADSDVVKLDIDKNLYVASTDDRVSIFVKSQGVATVTDDGYKYFEQVPDENEANDYVNTVFEALKKQDKNKKYQPILLSSNAITLSNSVQLVIRFYGEPEEIHKNYDFVHVTNYWTSWNKEVVTNTNALECMLSKELKYIGSLYPICSMMRVRKFLKRGWTINAGQMLKIAYQISELNLNDVEVLSEQLTGVDFAFFVEVIKILKKDVESGKSIDGTYLANLIDKIFEE